MTRSVQLRLSPKEVWELAHSEESKAKLKRLCSKAGALSEDEIQYCRIQKRSIDARGKKVVYNVKVEFSTDEPFEELPIPYEFRKVKNAPEVHIIGAGPAGFFAALELIKQGLKPVIFERGKAIRERRRDLAKLNKEQIVDPDSNYCFGEGGAGTYSDGKLYTRSKKRGKVDLILQSLVQFGAEKNILIDAHPHIGTNKLPQLIENIREFIKSCGGEVHFGSKLTAIHTDSDKIKAIEINGNSQHSVNQLILATGHSARDIFQLLEASKIHIEAKPFALGVRVEHPQELINEMQYGQNYSPYLPPASYRLVKQVEQKGVYSFCMCPGGIIAACATAPGEIVTNGWSPSRRNNPFANSGMVVEINEKDWHREKGVLAAMRFQSSIEKRAFQAVNKAENFGQVAPAQNMVNFIGKKSSAGLSACSYFPGIEEYPLEEILPKIVHKSLSEAFIHFGKQMKGYLSEEVNVVGVESRTSSPVRIPRDRESLNHTQINNLYPSGEGAGYAGGIVSAAMDGIAVARAIRSNSYA